MPGTETETATAGPVRDATNDYLQSRWDEGVVRKLDLVERLVYR